MTEAFSFKSQNFSERCCTQFIYSEFMYLFVHIYLHVYMILKKLSKIMDTSQLASYEDASYM